MVVARGKLLGEGFHSGYGKPHAEVEAIRSVPVHIQGLLSEATLYVTLEPCNHHGKTPPCTDLIIKTGIKKVVVGCLDPNPIVAGQGIEHLRAHGVDVQVAEGYLEQAAQALIRPFKFQILQKQPYLFMKWAQTADGFMAMPTAQRWITAPLTQRLTHLWRTQSDAILVGSGTVLTDNPALSARYGATKQPLRVVLDPSGRLDSHYNVFDKNARTILVSPKPQPMPGHIDMWPFDTRRLDGWHSMLAQLYQNQVGLLMVEGGVSLLHFIINHGLWHEARIIKSKTTWGEGLPAPLFQGVLHQQQHFGNDQVEVFYSRKVSKDP